MGKHTLKNGKDIELVDDWNGIQRPEHGKKLLDRDWDPSAKRTGLSFYESTDEYMRNDWAYANMHPRSGTIDGKTVTLFFHEKTSSWHSADALDIDHVRPWKAHLMDRDVANMGEANMAYNDISNLRLLPSSLNRARDSADKIVDTHGVDSRQWQQWCQERFGFNPDAPVPQYDPVGDLASRQKRTIESEWTDENKRSELSFDKAVKEKWFEQALASSYVTTVKLENPVKPGEFTDVPLFRCAATQQLLTRDAFDIDHQVAFESLLKVLPDHTNGETLTKANVLDAYNDTSNLRLISRSANSSHDFELNEFNDYKDSTRIKRERSGEFDELMAESDDDVESIDDDTRGELQRAMVDINESKRRMVNEYWAQQGGPQINQNNGHNNAPLLPPLNDPSHPYNPQFQHVLAQINNLNPSSQALATQTQRENMASSLMVQAKHEGLRGIDHVVWNNDHSLLVAVSGPLQSEHSRISFMRPDEGNGRSVAQNTQALAEVEQRQLAQAQFGPQPQKPFTL